MRVVMTLGLVFTLLFTQPARAELVRVGNTVINTDTVSNFEYSSNGGWRGEPVLYYYGYYEMFGLNGDKAAAMWEYLTTHSNNIGF